MPKISATNELHARCSVYTNPRVADLLTTLAGWARDVDLSDRCLLEPSCGDGALLYPAVRELLAWARRSGVPASRLAESLIAFEIQSEAANRSRERIRELLRDQGESANVASKLIKSWIRHGDFLLSDLDRQPSSVVANPPYVRWSRIPSALAKKYRRAGYSPADLSLLVMAKAVADWSESGRQAYLISDRWLSSAHGSQVREEILKHCAVTVNVSISSQIAFEKNVSAYASICVLERRSSKHERSFMRTTDSLQNTSDIRRFTNTTRSGRKRAQSNVRATENQVSDLFDRLSRAFPTIQTAGCKVGVGPALGNKQAFVQRRADAQVEADRIVPYIESRALKRPDRLSSDLGVLNPWDENGALVSLDQYPRLNSWLHGFREELRKRSCVVNQGDWYRTIDRISTRLAGAPKILVAGIAKKATLAIDHGEYVPDHGTYWIKSEEWPLLALYRVLCGGILDVVAVTTAPRLRQDHLRFQKRVITSVPLPMWKAASVAVRSVLTDENATSLEVERAVAKLYAIPIELWREATHRLQSRNVAVVA